MKPRFLVVISILFLLGNVIAAQQIEVSEVDDSEFPLVTFTIELPKDASIDFKELKVFENGEEVEISFDSSSFNGQRKMFCFLVDESLLTSSKSKELISDILVNSIENLEKPDLFNVLFTSGNETDDACMQSLSFEFTSDFNGLINQFKTNSLTGKANSKPKNLYCSVDASIDFIHSKSAMPGKKILIVLKKANSGIKDWESLKAKADVHLIKLDTIEFPDEINEKNGQSILLNTVKQLDSLSFSSLNNSLGLDKKNYLISFNTKQNNKLNNFEVSYFGQEIKASFKQPGYIGFIKQNLVFILVILFLLILSVFLTFNVIRTKKKFLISAKLSSIRKEKSIKKNIPPISHKKTNYGSITPYITVELENQVDKFELKKLRTTIGRHSDNDILIANLTISNHHATITNEGGIFYIQDNESTNGTFINDIKIKKTELKTEDAVRLGKAMLSLTY